MEDFETKLAAAGELLEKLASERGLSVSDFTEEETMDLLGTIMGEGTGDVGGGTAPAEVSAPAKIASAPAAAPAPVAAPGTTKVAYQVALAEVMKVAQANGFDLNKATPEELHSAVENMQEVMSDPQYGVKQAAFEEKIAEADALGRVMAHAYVDELGKIASATTATPATAVTPAPDVSEKKAAFVRELRAKVAGEMPPQFAAHAKGKGEGKGDDEDKDEKEKKAAFEKAASLRAAEVLVASGINPETGSKFASDQEQVEYGAKLILQQKGYLD